ncbi:hypothetical protein COT44_00210 [Candidatus Shapirobacteria bacterium CG08_land_8_20_14_0_20_39_18]|uniref:Uncharacterized protein n=1 Tax=Candidatus Shapirobacteria bacterium CG08_land_8_20_14_0_20_39_18 TaxID=1974883 RepID=A0A2M6XE82_9BACT|nr:MAG: hypothetical protein COT44_00210 [Candidatus Shapirobacteria bacterium CG08_land_8_20_14_0_20_39_18]PIY64691.1 MAG: hypothetical protein COY91_04450 [Candidatus Shapirobacteria bacterium CG_4_10_14_0_8_um_filter_39_15]
MSTIFYDHLIEFEEIEVALSVHNLDPKTKKEVSQMIEETIHYRMMNVILTNLPKEHHQDFLERFYQAPHDEGLFDYLKEKVGNIEDLLSQEIEKVKKELLADLKI